MKKFIISVLSVSVFFIGLGALVQKAGARFKSDDKALELVAKARQALGGDQALKSIQSLRITGRTTQTFNINGTSKSETGETEIALQLPDKMMKTIRMGDADGKGTAITMNHQMNVVVVGEPKDAMKVTVDAKADGVKKIVIKKDDGTVQELTGADAEKWIASHDPGFEGGNKLILRKADGNVQEINTPNGDKVIVRKMDDGNAVFATKDGGQTEVRHIFKKNADGTVEEVTGPDADKIILHKTGDDTAFFTSKDGKVEARKIEFAHAGPGEARSNELLRLTLSLLLTTPQGLDVSYTYGGESTANGAPCSVVVASVGADSYKICLDNSSNLPVQISFKGFAGPHVIKFDRQAAAGDPGKDVVQLRKIEGVAMPMSEVTVAFSDYRNVGGVQLPFRWAQTSGSDASETFDVTNYDINPANIGDAFKEQRVFVRTAKPDQK